MLAKRILALLVITIVFTSCGDGSGFLGLGSTPTSTPNLTGTREAKDAGQTEIAQIVTGTYYAQATQAMILLRTGTAEAKETYIAKYQAEKTEAADPMYQKVVAFYRDGYIHSTEGSYEKLKTFSRSWAQINWFDWFPTGFSPSNFVISSELHWESGAQRPNTFNSGCGFAFRVNENTGKDFYIVSLALDGKVYFKSWINGKRRVIDSAYYGKLNVIDGTATMDLVVEDSNVHVFINGEHMLTASDDNLTEGSLNFSLHSGTNKDFGIRCTTNADLWILE